MSKSSFSYDLMCISYELWIRLNGQLWDDVESKPFRRSMYVFYDILFTTDTNATTPNTLRLYYVLNVWWLILTFTSEWHNGEDLCEHLIRNSIFTLTSYSFHTSATSKVNFSRVTVYMFWQPRASRVYCFGGLQVISLKKILKCFIYYKNLIWLLKTPCYYKK